MATVVASRHSRHSYVCSSGKAPMPGIELAKRIGRPHCGQWGSRVSIASFPTRAGRASIQGFSLGGGGVFGAPTARAEAWAGPLAQIGRGRAYILARLDRDG